MEKQKEQLEHLSEIRNLMEKSSRFISLSGLSGVAAGIIAILGFVAACIYMDYSFEWPKRMNNFFDQYGEIRWNVVFFIFIDAITMLMLAIGLAIWFTTRNSKRKGVNIWDKTSKRLLVNMAIPLISGGIVCLILFYHKILFLIAPFTLIFYGLALVNASKYTLDDVKYLGLLEIALGLIAAVFVGYALVFWTIGFGILHIIYGLVMYYKYER